MPQSQTLLIYGLVLISIALGMLIIALIILYIKTLSRLNKLQEEKSSTISSAQSEAEKILSQAHEQGKKTLSEYQEKATKIVNEAKGINRVVYDISNKPPSTIEYE